MNLEVHLELDVLSNIKRLKFRLAIKDDDPFSEEKVVGVMNAIESMMQSYRRSDALDRISKYANN